MSDESDRMMSLLQELAVSRKPHGNDGSIPLTEERRKEISEEMKELASRKTKPEP